MQNVSWILAFEDMCPPHPWIQQQEVKESTIVTPPAHAICFVGCEQLQGTLSLTLMQKYAKIEICRKKHECVAICV